MRDIKRVDLARLHNEDCKVGPRLSDEYHSLPSPYHRHRSTFYRLPPPALFLFCLYPPHTCATHFPTSLLSWLVPQLLAHQLFKFKLYATLLLCLRGKTFWNCLYGLSNEYLNNKITLADVLPYDTYEISWQIPPPGWTVTAGHRR
jgi:hypothetical protein